MRNLILGAGLLMLLGGCASTPEPEYPPTPLTQIQAEWQLDLEESWQTQGSQGRGYVHQMALYADALYAADAQGQVYAWDLAQAQKIWVRDLQTPISSGVYADAQQVFVVSAEGQLYALNPQTGATNWQTPLKAEVLGAPQANADLVVVQSVSGDVWAFKRLTGELAWHHSEQASRLSLRVERTPLVTNLLTYVGTPEGKLLALDNRNGYVRWDVRISWPQGRTDIEKMTDISGQPQLSQGTLYTTGYRGKVAAVDPLTGEPRWAVEASSYLSAAVDAGTLVYVNEAGHLVALDAYSGRTLWIQDQLSGRGLSAPVFLDSQHLIVGDYQGYLHVLAAEDGRLVARAQQADAPIQAPVLRWKDQVISLSTEGDVHLWKFATNQP